MMKANTFFRSFLLSTALSLLPLSSHGQGDFWNNWYVQVGLDMSLQNPYGYKFSDVFPNGKTFGVDVAVGKWFTPEVGLRAKVNWENGIGLFRNSHANWLAPFHKPGVNMDKGGYLGVVGDVLLNLHNLFWSYDRQRRWNLSVFPRAGVDYNFGVRKGSPLVGLGIDNTYRLGDGLCLYADVAYNVVSSGHVGSESGYSTGNGSNSNGYLNIDLGVQIDLGNTGKRGFEAGGGDNRKALARGWFLQMGVDMSLQNPYGCNFSKVFPNGNTYGLDFAVGKQFTPEMALRVRANWENGLVENPNVEWVAPGGPDNDNFSHGGYLVANGDVMFNLHNILASYNENRRWETYAYARAGLISHFVISSLSPLVGLGVENLYRLDSKWSLFLDIDYQVTTSESSAGSTGMAVSAGSNGFFDVTLGAKLNL